MTVKRRSVYVPDRVRQLMFQRKLSIEEMAKKLGLSKYTLENTIRGISSPKLDTVIKIAEIFGVTLDWLCSEKQEGE